MDVLKLLAEAHRAGLMVEADGERLRIRGAQSGRGIAEQLGACKVEVLAALKCRVSPADALTDDRSLKNSRESGLLSAQPPVFDPPDPLVDFDWDSSRGYFPDRQILRNGIEHKRDDCFGQRGWRHIWGGTFCCACWPCTDLAAMVSQGDVQ